MQRLVKLVSALNPKIIVGMPAYNEAGRIENFIRELNEVITEVQLTFLVVDDASTDSTYQSLLSLSNTDINLEVHQNLSNRGHGPSTLRALSLAAKNGPDCILMIDGDGHFDAHEVNRVLTYFLANSFEVVEGVRVHRQDPLFRKIVSLATRFLVARRSRKWPIDANTPLRIYNLETARAILDLIPHNSLVPNLHISTVTRTKPFKFAELQINPFVRISSNPESTPQKSQTGTTWRQSIKNLPSYKFMKFCMLASTEWVKANKTK